MTFFDISRKMLKAGFLQISIVLSMQFICNGIILLFCSYFHKQDVYECVDCKFINTNNIYLPFFLSAVFLVFFLPVSCQAFLASRKQEYGVMFSLGWSRKERLETYFLKM